jgi:hypothetical protein
MYRPWQTDILRPIRDRLDVDCNPPPILAQAFILISGGELQWLRLDRHTDGRVIILLFSKHMQRMRDLFNVFHSNWDDRWMDQRPRERGERQRNDESIPGTAFHRFLRALVLGRRWILYSSLDKEPQLVSKLHFGPAHCILSPNCNTFIRDIVYYTYKLSMQSFQNNELCVCDWYTLFDSSQASHDLSHAGHNKIHGLLDFCHDIYDFIQCGLTWFLEMIS